jgi:glycosyltransferase involved in cell wall biosynthesis
MTKNLKIAMLGTRGVPATFGGVEHHVEQIGARLVERGHDVTVYSQRRYSGGDRLTEHLGMHVVTLPTVPVRSLEAISHAAMATVHGLPRGYDVVHYHAVGPGLVSPLARYGSRAKVVQTIHGLDADRAKWGGGARRVLNLATWLSAHVPDRTITVSQSLSDHYAERYGSDTLAVPNGVNAKTRREVDIIRRHGLRGGDYLLFVGRLVPEKRPDLLIKAFAQVKTDVKLVVAGGSSYTDDYVAELERLAALDPRVVLTGYVYGDELDELFTNALGFVQPSALEGLPLTLLEAIGSGLPVVVSDIPPHREIVGESRPGARVVADGDTDVLRRVLQQVLAAPEHERRGARALRQPTLAAYDWDACVDALEDSYYSALGLPTRPRRPVLPALATTNDDAVAAARELHDVSLSA